MDGDSGHKLHAIETSVPLWAGHYLFMVSKRNVIVVFSTGANKCVAGGHIRRTKWGTGHSVDRSLFQALVAGPNRTLEGLSRIRRYCHDN